MAVIERINVGSERLCSWGITANDYVMDGKQVDFQDLLVNVSKLRAAKVEAEIQPLSTRIRARNTLLDDLGDALSVLSGAQAAFSSSDGGSATTNVTFSASAKKAMKLCGKTQYAGTTSTYSLTKRQVEELVQLVKSKIDSYNNQSQTDMTRLQSLVDRRDQSYSAATDLMTSVSDTRSNLISNIG